MRIKQKIGTRGSLKWLQLCVNEQQHRLNHEALGDIVWRSPLVEDDYAEYRDGEFLRLLGLEDYAGALSDFWPSRGPQWDALGMAGDKVILVEAKAYLNEMASSCAAGEVSRTRIEAAFRQVCDDLGVADSQTWTKGYYQLANRIAHLWFLRKLNIDAHLLLVGFSNDDEMGGPSEAKTWAVAYHAAEAALGLGMGHKLSPFIHHIYPDVRLIATT